MLLVKTVLPRVEICIKVVHYIPEGKKLFIKFEFVNLKCSFIIPYIFLFYFGPEEVKWSKFEDTNFQINI